MFEMKVLSVKECVWKDRERKTERTYYKAYVADDTGAVGYVSTKEPPKNGIVKLAPRVSKDGYMVLHAIE